MDKKFLIFITPGELLAYDVERKEYIGINDNTSFKYCENADIEYFCACIADQLGEEKFADLAATVTVVNCGANLLYVDKLYNVLEGCKEKNVLNVERVLPLIAFTKGIKKEQQLCFQVFGQYYFVESNANSEICARGIDRPQAETIELKAEDFALVYRLVVDGQCGEELEKVKQQLSENEQAWKQEKGEWESKFNKQNEKLSQLEKENKVYKDKEQAELERQKRLEEERKRFKVGDVIKFGEYQGEEIEWKILDIQDGKALIISKDVILFDSFYYKWAKYITWKDSTLRTYLNADFFTGCINENKRGNVMQTSYDNGMRSYIFLLSVEQVKKYFSSELERQCRVCNSTRQQGMENGRYNGYPITTNRPSNDDPVSWWTRSECSSPQDSIVTIKENGGFGECSVHWALGVRPAMWVDLSKM